MRVVKDYCVSLSAALGDYPDRLRAENCEYLTSSTEIVCALVAEYVGHLLGTELAPGNTPET